MSIKGHTRTSIYIRDDLYVKMRELNFNVSEFLNRCLDMILTEENTEDANLLNEDRALMARHVEIQQRRAVVRTTTTLAAIKNQQKAEAGSYEDKKQREAEMKDAEALFQRDPKAYAIKYLGGTGEENEATPQD